MFSLDGYQALRTRGGVVRRTDRGVLALSGRDRTTWLQGLVTNDVESLVEGASCYAAYLTPQGRMITDMNVFAQADRLLLDVPASLVTPLRERFDGLIFSEDVQVHDDTARHEVWTTIKPGLPAGGEISEMIVDRGRSVPFDFEEIDLETFEVVRVEHGLPKFLVDMDEHTIPLEAGIEDRAISFTKGCYVGQEVVVRVTYRGGGRVAKRLVRWQADRLITAVPPASAAIRSETHDIGRVTSAVFSPSRERVVGLGYVHRDFVELGTRLTVVWDDARIDATVI